MSRGLKFDEETSRSVEALYLTPDVVAQRCQVLKALQLREGERVLDVGVGPGLLAYDMAASDGPEGQECGIDISDDMLAMARKRCADQSWTEYQRADATDLPYPDLVISLSRIDFRPNDWESWGANEVRFRSIASI